MLCISPKNFNGSEIPCRKCIPCRLNRQHGLVGRQIIEMQHSETALWITLTYTDETVPKLTDGTPTLHKKDVQKFLKRLRKSRPGATVRYFAVGEYGSTTQRPHYHLCLFGTGGFQLSEEECSHIWGQGFIQYSLLNLGRMAYTAKYAVKGLTHENNEKLYGREPEFAQWSRIPPLGYQLCPGIVRYYQTKAGADQLAIFGDIQKTFRYQGKSYHLGEWNINRIRAQLGIPATMTERDLINPHSKDIRIAAVAARIPLDVPATLKLIEKYDGKEKTKVYRSETRYL